MDKKRHLRLLGVIEIEPAELIPPSMGPLARALLCYLLAENRPVPHEDLLRLFWPDSDDKTGLNRELTALRKFLPDGCIHNHNSAISLHCYDILNVDLFTFDKYLKKGDIDSLVHALNLYRGEFMYGFLPKWSDDYGHWLTAKRATYREKALAAMQSLMNQHADSELCLEFTSRLLAITPDYEEFHRLRMLALARKKQWSEALKQYEMCRRILKEEPSAETQLLYQQILEARKLPPSSLPAQRAPLIGRDNELAAIFNHLANPTCRLVTVLGLGGMGKTSLALALGHIKNHSFLYGAHYVPLTFIPDETFIMRTIAEALNVPLAPKQNTQDLILSFLKNKELLLILDNFDHLVTNGAHLLEGFLNLPKLKLIVTSRERLGLHGEQILDLRGLSFPQEQEMAHNVAWETFAAIRLFEHAARRVQPHFSLTTSNIEDVVRICRLAEGMPLMIELAASWVHAISCSEIANGISNLAFLDELHSPRPTRHHSLHATFDYSWQLLAEEERRAMCRISVFQGGFKSEAARIVVGAAPRTLVALANKSLIYRSERYHVHELLRQFAAEKLIDNSIEWEETYQKYAHYFADMVSARALEVRTGKKERSDLHADVAAEMDNIRASWNWAVDKFVVEVIDKLIPTFSLHILRGWYQEGLQMVEAALNIFPKLPGDALDMYTGDQLTIARLLSRKARFLFLLGHIEDAEKPAQYSLKLLRSFEQQEEEIVILLNMLGLIAHNQSRLADAEQYYEESLQLSNQLERFSTETISSILSLAVIYRTLGKYPKAMENILRGLELCKEKRYERDRAYCLGNLAMLYRDLGDYTQALAILQEVIKVFENHEDSYGLAIGLVNKSDILLPLGRYVEAKKLGRDALGKLKKLGNEYVISYGLIRFAEAATLTGQFGEAHDLYAEAILILEKAKVPTQMAVCFNGYGTLLCAQRKYNEANQWFHKGLDIHRKHGYQQQIALSLLGLGKVASGLNQTEEALKYYGEALEIAVAIQLSPLMIDILIQIADIFLSLSLEHRKQALIIIHMVREHSASTKHTQYRAQELFKGIRARHYSMESHIFLHAKLEATSLEQAAREALSMLQEFL